MRIDSKDLSSPVRRGERVKKAPVKSIKEAGFKDKLAELSQNEIRERLDKLLSIVDEQGQRLKESLDKNSLLEYKRRVKQFLRVVQKEFVKAHQSFSWDSKGNLKTLTIIKKVDENLEVLHEMFMEEQADVLKIVQKIDEIRGLLLDLYI
ncbi:YaaR family protein [Halothermothrix orenii]|uniref:Uncharacterized protein conserved in bacteria n=1 Tax=Halothermothrix orenii (strain H 168 / OCM 544 / DSM 9562) TaxID=373903 RepID=B8CYD3_HALOH|nr:YaaR family protein [Halothermothrix orenii]ACL70302.1 uncharacterized protein conserved in bacteria [Halothermothrix orenii H 168]